MTGKARAGIIRFMVVFTLLMRFFRRTLIQYGALRSGMVRWSLTALAAAWMVFSCVVAKWARERRLLQRALPEL